MADDPYCYPHTDVLRNLLDIRDAGALQAAENVICIGRAPIALAFANSEDHLNFASLQAIHKLLFGDLYSWAGEVRTVVIARGSFQFMPPPILGAVIDQTVIEPFHQFAGTSELTAEALARELGKLWPALNHCHPFRYGNGRSAQIFVQALARRHGFDVDWTQVDRVSDSAAGMASLRGNPVGYIAILARALRRFDVENMTTGFWRR